MNDDLTRPSNDISQWCVVGNSPVLNEVDCVQDELNEESVGIQPEAVLQASMHVLMKQASELAGMQGSLQACKRVSKAARTNQWLSGCMSGWRRHAHCLYLSMQDAHR